MAKKRQDLQAIKDRFPSIEKLDWDRAFAADIDLWGRVLRDIVKVGQDNTGKPGPRAPLSQKDAAADLRFLMNDEHTMLPLREIVPILSQGMSIRELAEATGLNRNVVHRLMTGVNEPDANEIEHFAKAFRKDPSFFTEYRILYVLSALEAHMSKYPESSVSAYIKAQRVA